MFQVYVDTALGLLAIIALLGIIAYLVVRRHERKKSRTTKVLFEDEIPDFAPEVLPARQKDPAIGLAMSAWQVLSSWTQQFRRVQPRVAGIRLNLANPRRGQVLTTKALPQRSHKRFWRLRRNARVRIERARRWVDEWSLGWMIRSQRNGQAFKLKALRRLKRFSPLLRHWLKVRARLYRLKARRWTRENWYSIGGAASLVALFIALAIWINRSTGEFGSGIGNFLTSIPIWAWLTIGVLALIGLVWFFRTHVEIVDDPGDTSPRVNYGGSWFGKTLSGMLIMVTGVLLLVGFNQGLPGFIDWANSPRASASTMRTAPPVVASIDKLPEDAILAEIARCESGGEQFEADSVTPKRNSGSSAVGKYQILEKTHKADIEEQGLDVAKSEADNEKFARFLLRRDGLKPWESSRWCWEGRLLSFAGLPPATQRRIVEAGPEGTQYVSIPGGWGIRWSAERRDAKYRVETLEGDSVDFPTDGPTLTRDSSSIRFRSLETEPVRIEVWFVIP